MVLKRGRKSEKKKKKAYGFANLKKNCLQVLSSWDFKEEVPGREEMEENLPLILLDVLLSKPKFRISHLCWFPRWQQ